jgi:hypothetical protein
MDLKHFACAQCSLTGLLPTWGADACLAPGGLMTFDVAYNSLTYTLPTTFDGFGALQALNISHNNLTGDFLSPVQCGGFPQLQYLRVSHNNFTVLSSGELMATLSCPFTMHCNQHLILMMKEA